MEFSNPKIDRYVFDRPWLDDRITLIEQISERQWADNQAHQNQNAALVESVHRAAGNVADYVRKAQGIAVLNDLGPNGEPLEYAEAEGGSLLGGERRPYVLESEFVKLQRIEAKARAALADFQRKSKPAAGTKGWGNVVEEVKALVGDLAMNSVDIQPYTLKGKPSRKGMTEAAKIADAGHVRHKLVMEAVPDRTTAEAMVRGLVRAESPLHLSICNYGLAHDLRLPLVDVKWGPGRNEPLPEDTAAMFTFLAAERIEDDLLEQLDRRYGDFAERGVLMLTAPERRRELAIAQAAIDSAEVEEAAHLIGVIESDGAVIRPPARMSAKALLGIA